MTDKEPTQEQIREFWEWCGFHFKEIKGYERWGEYWKNSEDTYCKKTLPSIDLNNLFKYAVPLAIDKIMAEQGCSSDLAYAILFKKWLQRLELDIPNHVGTLFWAVREVIKK